MQIKKEPEAQVCKPVYVCDLLSTNANVYVIESVLQREYVWPYSEIRRLWDDIFDCICDNHGKGTETYDKNLVYTGPKYFLGNLETSEVDASKLKELPSLTSGAYCSVVDGSQRIRSILFCSIAFQYWKAVRDENEYISLDMFKHITDGVWKICEFGVEGYGELGKFYEYLSTHKIKEISRELKKRAKSLIKKMSKKEAKKDYFDIFAIFVNLINEHIVKKDANELDEMFNILMKNVFFYDTIISIDNKFARFVDCNKKGTPMTDADLYPKYVVCNYNDSDRGMAQKAFNKFRDYARMLEEGGDDRHFRETKSGIHSIQWIMTTVLKNSLIGLSKTNESINQNSLNVSTFSLSDVDYGIEQCFKSKLLFNEDVRTAINYFNECYNLSDFLFHSFDHHSDNLSHCYYYLRDMSRPNVLWWYFINPSYLAKKLYLDKGREDVNSFIMGALYRLYGLYHVRRGAGDTNSQKLIDILSELSSCLILHESESDSEIINTVREICLRYVSSYEDIYNCVQGLSYNKLGCSTRSLGTVLTSIEYGICDKLKLSLSDFFKLYYGRSKKQQFDLDHWYPQKEFKENPELSRDYNQLGNIVLLERSLNRSKGCNADKTSDIYKQSHFVGTLLLNSSTRGTLTNEQLECINEMGCVARFDESDVDSPSLEMIKLRTKKISDYYVNYFLKGFFEA